MLPQANMLWAKVLTRWDVYVLIMSCLFAAMHIEYVVAGDQRHGEGQSKYD
jgi:hypothetical protein